MSEKAIEILIRLRAEQAEKGLTAMAAAARAADKSVGGVDREAKKAETSLLRLAAAERAAERDSKLAERGINKLSATLGGSQLTNSIDDMGDGVEAIGVAGAASVVGLGLMTKAMSALGTEALAIMRDVDALAPKFESLAGQEIISQESIDASHVATTNLDKLWTLMDGMIGVMVDRFAPAIETVSSAFVKWGTVALNVYKIIGDISKAMYSLDLGAFGDAVFGTTEKTKGTSIGASYQSGMGRDEYTPGTTGDPTKGLREWQAKQAAASTKAATGVASAPVSAATKYAISGPSSGGMAQIDTSLDALDVGMVELTRDISAWAVEIDLSSEYIDDAAESMTALNTTLVENRKAARAAKLGSIAGGIGTAQSIVSGGTAGIANALSAAGPAGAVAGAVLSMGDMLAEMGTEGLQEMIDGVLQMPVTVLEMLPEILTETIPALLTDGIPDLISGIILALPEIIVALAELIPILIESLWMMQVDLIRNLVKGIADAIIPGGKGGAKQGDSKVLDWVAAGVFNVMGREKKPAYVDPSAGPRSGGGSTARTSAPSGGEGEQHVHVHIGSHVGTDAKSARDLARLLKQHMGTRGTGLALE